MTQPAALSLLRNRAANMEELRRLLPGIGSFRTALPFGLAALDSYLPEGGLVCGALHEVVPAGQAAMPAAFGFIAAVLAHVFPSSLRGEDGGWEVR